MASISIMVPTRNREYDIIRLLDSIKNTAHNTSNIEVVVTHDNDDLDSKRVLNAAKDVFDFKIDAYEQVKDTVKPFNLSECFNCMAAKTTGDFLWALNDDAFFCSEGWDSILLSSAEKYLADKPDKVAYIAAGDSTNSKSTLESYCCFPIMTRNSYNVLGHFFHKEMTTWGADCSLWYVFDAIGRNLNLTNEIIIDHKTFHFNIANPEDGTMRVIRDSPSFYMESDFYASSMSVVDCVEKIASKDIRKLRQYIDSFSENKERVYHSRGKFYRAAIWGLGVELQKSKEGGG